ncbi:transporter substrate-binding domain-containing protein [Paraburkholderia oxyphila]|uniref:transporter substrate-binding domain-containing protein n=1 Tax=Paraburkholderia oxyphila TaxID=614212 RepID=UPI000489772B|nr:transporter substrate-binding domain-containing protein [Paraburkholderia oxyphila]
MLALPLLLLQPAGAQVAQPTLDKVRAANMIAIGYRETSVPFSYVDANGNVIGFSQDICNHVVDAIKAQMHRPNLQVRFIPVTSQNRIPLVQNGTVDLECGVTTNLQARHSQVTFSDTFFIASTRLLTRKDSGIHDFGDLVGKTVLTNQGTTSETILRRMNLEKHMNMQVISAKDYRQGREILESGRAVAYMMDDVLLAGTRSLTAHPSDWVIVGTPQSWEPYAFMLRNGDPAFQQLVNETMSALMKSGQIGALYTKWFEQPVPPKGVNFHFPMSDTLRALYAAPNDRALD